MAEKEKKLLDSNKGIIPFNVSTHRPFLGQRYSTVVEKRGSDVG